MNFRYLKRYVCDRYESCKQLTGYCSSNYDTKIYCHVPNDAYEPIDRYSLFKIDDEVEITNKCNDYCSAIHPNQPSLHPNQPSLKEDNKYGIIINIGLNEHLPIYVEHNNGGVWHHFPECLKHINKGFDPEYIISKAFGGS